MLWTLVYDVRVIKYFAAGRKINLINYIIMCSCSAYVYVVPINPWITASEPCHSTLYGSSAAVPLKPTLLLAPSPESLFPFSHPATWTGLRHTDRQRKREWEFYLWEHRLHQHYHQQQPDHPYLPPRTSSSSGVWTSPKSCHNFRKVRWVWKHTWGHICSVCWL